MVSDTQSGALIKIINFYFDAWNLNKEGGRSRHTLCVVYVYIPGTRGKKGGAIMVKKQEKAEEKQVDKKG